MSGSYDKRYIRVAEFYDGKSILITGAAGFLGVVLLETLLRCCPNIKIIYILLRPKKGVQPESRKDLIFENKCFDKLKAGHPDALSKVRVVVGDVAQPDLGMNSEDLQKVIRDVSIVFHCAASVSFLKPLRFILSHNAVSTQNAIEVCRKLEKLDALVYTSTAYSNCNRKTEIEEEVYRLPFPATRFLTELKDGNDDKLQELVSECQPNWPNYYSFSKCLAENVIKDNASDLPVVIIRPSIIISVWKGSLPGYIDGTSGIQALTIGVGKGFIRVLHGDPNVKMDLVPVDVVVNAHIISAWNLAASRSSSPLVVNCTGVNCLTLGQYNDFMMQLAKKHPMPNSYQKATTLHIQKNNLLYWMAAAFEHYAPAIVIDTMLKLTGKKPRLVPLYRFFDSAMSATMYFLTNSWTYKMQNIRKIRKQLDSDDREIFHTDLSSFDLRTAAIYCLKGAPCYQWEFDKKSIDERAKITNKRYWFTTFIKAMVLFFICFLLYLILSQALWAINVL